MASRFSMTGKYHAENSILPFFNHFFLEFAGKSFDNTYE